MEAGEKFQKLFSEIHGIDDAIEQLQSLRKDKMRDAIKTAEKEGYGHGIVTETRGESEGIAFQGEGWSLLGFGRD